MQFPRTFNNEASAHVAAKQLGLTDYFLRSQAEPVSVAGPMGTKSVIPNVRYCIVYNEQPTTGTTSARP